MSFSLLNISLCLSLILDTSMLNKSFCLNISGDAASKWSKYCCTSEVPSLDLDGDRSIGNGNSLPMATTDKVMSVPSTGTEFQTDSANNTHFNHWWRLPLSADFIFCTLFKYLVNPSFIIALWSKIANACTGISKVSWKFLLDIIAKIPSESTTIIFGIPNGTKKFQKYHCVAWTDVISFRPMSAPRQNSVIQSRHVRIIRNTYRSGMYPVYQKSRNTTSNEVSDSILWSNCYAPWDHVFTNLKYAQALINWATSLSNTGHKNRASILNKDLWSWLCPANGDTWHAEITTCMNFTGTTLRLSCLTLALRRAL